MSWKLNPPPRSGKTMYATTHCYGTIESKLYRRLLCPKTWPKDREKVITVKDLPLSNVLTPIVPLNLAACKAMRCALYQKNVGVKDDHLSMRTLSLKEGDNEILEKFLAMGRENYSPEQGNAFFSFVADPTVYYSGSDNPWYESVIYNPFIPRTYGAYVILEDNDGIAGIFHVSLADLSFDLDVKDEGNDPEFAVIDEQWVSSRLFINMTFLRCSYPQFEDFETEGIVLQGFKTPQRTVITTESRLSSMAEVEFNKNLYEVIKTLVRKLKLTDETMMVLENIPNVVKQPNLASLFIDKLKKLNVYDDVKDRLDQAIQAFTMINVTQRNDAVFDSNITASVGSLILHRNSTGNIVIQPVNLLLLLTQRRGRGFIDSWTPLRYFNKTEYGLMPGGVASELYAELSAAQRDGKYLWFWTTKDGGDPFDSVEITNFQTGELACKYAVGTNYLERVIVTDRDTNREIAYDYVYRIVIDDVTYCVTLDPDNKQGTRYKASIFIEEKSTIINGFVDLIPEESGQPQVHSKKTVSPVIVENVLISILQNLKEEDKEND